MTTSAGRTATAVLADDTSGTTVAVHPERTDDTSTVRWHVAGGLPGGDDALLRADPYIAQLISAGVLADVAADGAIVTTLASGNNWAGVGGVVREAVQHAVATLGESSLAEGRDCVLARLARQVVHDETGPYVASHGGGIDLLGVRADVVYVRMRGACNGCTAASWTVQARLERRLRAGAPWLVAVRVAEFLPARD